ncbi:RHS domain-containing protein [Geomonas sp. RF6]|uniref:RHS repeat domain-containing protein n=1 Tax=Geomonas sp. RF6 TaxID=2897342 RepID=UPI001E2F6744|nr:RHS repeat-associated core domain-containing protein [Geomonas sp. RF6]UFS70504.1 RHS domain-containing protein [Geomonas sp. RF6]
MNRRIKRRREKEGEICLLHGPLLNPAKRDVRLDAAEYDSAGRKTKETRPLGQATVYTYYPDGLLKTVTDAKGQLTTYSYDPVGHLTEVLYADGRKDTFDYDGAGNLTSYGKGGVSGNIGYDELNRKVSETVNFGTFSKSFSYSYDARGNKETFVSPEGTAYTYGYDKNNQLTSITFLGRQVVLDYDRGRLWKTAFPNGLFTEYGYNDASWLSSMTRKNAGGTVEENGYGFDKIGNIISKGSGAGSSAYGYDLTYQLTSATHQTLPAEGFSYDDAGNRTASSRGAESASYSHNGSNETQAAGSATFTYDANGNTVSKTEGEATTTFVYNSADRLEQVFLPDGSTATYTYDPFGRRIKKDVNGEITYYLYSDEGLIGEYDASGNAEKGYGWKPDGIWGSDPLFMTEDGNYYFYQNDHLGTPQKLVDDAGNIVWAAEYTAFGEAVIDPASTVENNLRFPGQYFDEETGLHYNWHRYFNPAVGRYVQVDPLGFAAGDANLYRYVGNSVLKYVDPAGFTKGDWWDLRTWVSVSYSSTVFFKGSTINNGVEQKTTSTDWFGASIDIQIGSQIPINKQYSETTLGFSRHLGVGVYSEDGCGVKSKGGIALHFGLGIPLIPPVPLSKTTTYPSTIPTQPSFPKDLEIRNPPSRPRPLDNIEYKTRHYYRS